MLRYLLFVLVIFVCGAGAACSSAEAPNANANTGNANLPPEFSGNVVTPSGNSTPGIPDPNTMNANNVPKGATPTPGIPDPKDIGKPMPKGATPTPGIPDAETLKRQARTVITNMDLVNNPENANTETKPTNRKKPGLPTKP